MKIENHMVQFTYWQALVWAALLFLAGHEWGGAILG